MFKSVYCYGYGFAPLRRLLVLSNLDLKELCGPRNRRVVQNIKKKREYFKKNGKFISDHTVVDDPEHLMYRTVLNFLIS